MRILIVAPAVPYPLSLGGNCVQFGVVDRLRGRHEFHYTFPIATVAEKKALNELQRLWPEVSFHPFFCQRRGCWSPLRSMERIVRRLRHCAQARSISLEDYLARKRARRAQQLTMLLREPEAGWSEHVARVAAKVDCDVAQVEFIENAGLAPALENVKRRIFIHHELASVRLERELLALGATEDEATRQGLCCAERECAMLRNYHAVVTLTEEDRARLIRHMPEQPVFVSPPGIPLPEESGPAPIELCGDLAFVGGEGHYPNLDAIGWFLESIWPRIRSARPTAQLLIAGAWRADTRMVFGRVPGVKFLGFVPDLARALAGTILIAPIRIGSGVRIKLIQGAALALPIISTTIGAEGLGLRPGIDFARADTADEWISEINRFLNNRELCEQMASIARKTMIERFYKERTTCQREEIFNRVYVREKAVIAISLSNA